MGTLLALVVGAALGECAGWGGAAGGGGTAGPWPGGGVRARDPGRRGEGRPRPTPGLG